MENQGSTRNISEKSDIPTDNILWLQEIKGLMGNPGCIKYLGFQFAESFLNSLPLFMEDLSFFHEDLQITLEGNEQLRRKLRNNRS